MCALFWGEESQKVYGLYNHEHVDIYGRLLNEFLQIEFVLESKLILMLISASYYTSLPVLITIQDVGCGHPRHFTLLCGKRFFSEISDAVTIATDNDLIKRFVF